MAGSSGSGRTPTYGLRFEAFDDLLVEYTDHLRHGRLRVPIVDGPALGTAARFKLMLPDGATLYLTGTSLGAHDAGPDGEGGFLFRLDPLAPEQREQLQGYVDGQLAAAAAPAREESVDLATLHVLLVDDSVSVRIELGDALRARKIRVRVAENGLLALSAALKRRPDVILTDVEMPVMDGWTLLRLVRARERLADVPVVFMTHLTDELSRLQGYRMGVDDYLPKSMAADEIIARVQGVLTRRLRQRAEAPAGEGLRGDLEHVRLGSLLSFLETEKQTGVLSVEHATDRATVHIRRGTLAQVEDLGALRHPHDRMFELLDWEAGVFEFSPRSVDELDALIAARGGGKVTTPLTYLLMEHARRSDEAAAGR
jgi:DNA-binding response OmpR family regulator